VDIFNGEGGEGGEGLGSLKKVFKEKNKKK